MGWVGQLSGKGNQDIQKEHRRLLVCNSSPYQPDQSESSDYISVVQMVTPLRLRVIWVEVRYSMTYMCSLEEGT